MLKLECSDKGTVSIEAAGTGAEIVAQFAMLIGNMYNIFEDGRKGHGEVFRDMLIETMREDSPMWEAGKPDAAARTEIRLSDEIVEALEKMKKREKEDEADDVQ